MATRRAAKYGLVLGTTSLLGYSGYRLTVNNQPKLVAQLDGLEMVHTKGLPSRADQITALQMEQYDVLVIGGGATGCGVALDSATRGLRTALVELDDFSSGTSSKSTKLLHGGVRYLQKAIFNLDRGQYRMVKEALNERENLLRVAPHLSYPLPIMLPIYSWYKVPYYWVGIKAYDLVAGAKNLKPSYYLPKTLALELFPMLKKEKLSGALVYYDGQHDDARTNICLAMTAVRYGANIANHVEVISLVKGEDGKVCGARVRDQFTKKEWDIKAKSVVNATGPFTDSIRKMDDPKTAPICAPSAGVHIVLPGYYSPANMGLLDPSTSDGRVIFFLPWQQFTIAGTTDKYCEITHHPSPTEEDIQFILLEIRKYLNADVNVRRGDVMSSWSGIRPLVKDPNKAQSQEIARNHIIHASESGLFTIAGGKWTTYRQMAEETVDAVVKAHAFQPERGCQTKDLMLEGAKDWTPTMYIKLVQDYGLEPIVAKHLASTYGDRAFAVAKLADLTGKKWPVLGRRLHSEFPYITAEIRFATREYACTAVDVIARRLRLAFLNVEAAEEVLPKVIEIMTGELNWSKQEAKEQLEMAREFLRTEMGQNVNKELRDKMPINMTRDEVNKYVKQFHSMDTKKKGYITMNDLRKSLKASNVKMTDEELHQMLTGVDIVRNGQVEMGEFLQFMHGIKTGDIVDNRLAKALNFDFPKISVERSGGGV